MTLTTLSVSVTEAYPDHDVVQMDFLMPIILDDVNRDRAAGIVAEYMDAMASELKGLDKRLRPVQ